MITSRQSIPSGWPDTQVSGVFGSGVSEDKADPYGTTQPSPIPNPTDSPGGEPVPDPGLPPEYPSYLKPIPINTRDIEQEMRGYLNSEEPGLMRVLYSTWNAERDAIKYQEIRNAIRDGEFSDGFLAKFQQDYNEMINEELAPRWNDAMKASAENVAGYVESEFGVFPRFQQGTQRIREWVQTRGGELAVNLSRQQHQALRNILTYHITENPAPPRELARLIRGSIGLTSKQAAYVSNFREQLQEAGELTASQIEHRVQNYIGRLHRLRAERIARTELAWGYHQGMFEQMRQAQEGPLSGHEIVKRWWTAGDERVCSHCGPLHRQVVGMEQTFPGATPRVPNTYTPPAHPSCRCGLIYEVLSQ